MSGKRASGLALIAITLPAAALAAAPAVFEATSKLTGSKSQCMQRASAILQENSFTAGAAPVDPTVDIIIGARGDYRALIRCDMADGIAVFVVAGPQQDQALDYVTTIWKNF